MTIIRQKSKGNGKETLGTFSLDSNEKIGIVKGVTMELPWKDNKHQVSCIPEGHYKVVPRVSKAHGKHFHILNVPGRDMILIHEGNYVTNFLGCIGVGQSFADLNKDGLTDITATKAKLAELVTAAPNGFDLYISSI